MITMDVVEAKQNTKKGQKRKQTTPQIAMAYLHTKSCTTQNEKDTDHQHPGILHALFEDGVAGNRSEQKCHRVTNGANNADRLGGQQEKEHGGSQLIEYERGHDLHIHDRSLQTHQRIPQRILDILLVRLNILFIIGGC